MRSLLLEELGKGHYLIANYSIAEEHGGGGYGHFSPIAAYDEASDMFLIIDVWWDWDQFWIKSELLYQSINGIDSESGKTRGIIVINK